MRLLIITALLFVTVTQATKAADPWADWVGVIKNKITNAVKAKEVVATQIRDIRCPQQQLPAAQTACVAAYDVIIARLDAAQAEMGLKVAVVALDPKQRDHVLLNVLKGYNKFVNKTSWMGGQFDLMFPVPSHSPTPKK